MVLTETVVKNWANALVRIALKEKKVDAYIDQAHAIIEVLKMNPDYIALLSAHHVNGDTEFRNELIDKSFGKFQFDTHIINAMKILSSLEAFSSVRDVFKQLRRMLSKDRNIVYGTVWSTVTIEASKLKIIEQKISKEMGGEVRLVNKMDPKLIGGIQVIVANKVYDGSLKGKLDDLKAITTQNR